MTFFTILPITTQSPWKWGRDVYMRFVLCYFLVNSIVGMETSE